MAVELATSGRPHAALVLESTFTDVRRVGDDLAPRLPLGRLLDEEYPSLRRLRESRYDRPLFVSHGTRDRLIGIAHGRELAAAARGPVRFLALEGMGHCDRRGGRYGAAVRDFLAEQVARDGVPPDGDGPGMTSA